MPPLLFYPYFRILLIYSSAALSLILMMLMLNIITIPEIIKILQLEGTPQAQVITQVLGRMQEVTGNIMEIIAKLFSKVLNSFGMGDIDISKIKIQPGTNGVPPIPAENIGAGETLSNSVSPTNPPNN
jgi:hypothetical protein